MKNSKAFIFPGQGSQYAGMGRSLYDNFAVARHIFEEADDALGFNISKLCFDGPEEDLKLTANTQPAILTVSIAAFRVLQTETGIMPICTAGHSLGEYSSLVASGAMKFADALRTVRQRGTFMQEAVPVGTGSMAAMLGISADELNAICLEASSEGVVSPANYNSPGQIVIAGSVLAVAKAIEIAKAKGYRKTMLLPVSAPFHCSLMKPAAERLSDVLEPLVYSTPDFPVIANVTAKPNSDPSAIRSLLVDQVCAPVLWEQSVVNMVESGVTSVVEIGPGKVLSGLVKRINKEITAANIEDKDGLSQF